jgi:hypothetical protein
MTDKRAIEVRCISVEFKVSHDQETERFPFTLEEFAASLLYFVNSYDEMPKPPEVPEESERPEASSERSERPEMIDRDEVLFARPGQNALRKSEASSHSANELELKRPEWTISE